jgi:predicted Zn-dependent protease with MMP-like domain
VTDFPTKDVLEHLNVETELDLHGLFKDVGLHFWLALIWA